MRGDCEMRQLQYLALVFGPGLSQLGRERKDFRLAGIFFLILIVGSPNLTTLTLPVDLSLTYTPNFLFLPGVLNGLFNLTSRPLYFAIINL